jgi:hypothetical protein
MDLKQKQASLTEALYARESARDTARQGKTVIVFTVVTIIFVSTSSKILWNEARADGRKASRILHSSNLCY